MLILLQMAFVVNLVVYLSSASVYVYSLLELVSAASVIWLVSKNENPSYKPVSYTHLDVYKRQQ